MKAIGAILSGIAFVFLVSGANATSVRFARGPSELPPPGFKGMQFVDSKGCAYIKAGYSGSVTWVPRAHRNRQVMCGLKPTFATVAATVNASKPRVIKTTTVRRAKVKVKPAAKFAAKKTRPSFSGTPAPSIFTAYKAKSHAAPAKPLRLAQRPAATARKTASAAPAPTVFTGQRPKQSAKLTARPQRSRQGIYAIRRGPQKVHPADAIKRYRLEHGIQVASAPYAVPKGYVSLLNETPATARLGVGTPEGQAAMDLLWTQTMPRRLIDVTTGNDMTARLPQIKYPYTREPVRVARASAVAPSAKKSKLKRIKKPARDEASPLNMTSLERITSIQDVSAQTSRQPSQAVVQPVASHRFVQVATFGVPNNAQRTRAKFSQIGLPVETRPTRYKGRKMDIVLLGPFRDQRMLNEALSQAHAAGFTDALFVN